MAAPDTTSIVIPACNEAAVIGDVVSKLVSSGPWREIIVVDDGSSDRTADHAEAAGAIVVRHPYNKGNGAAVKSGIRRASGDCVLVMDGDGQHRPADARRLVEHVGEYDLVIGAREGPRQATFVRRTGNAVLNRLAAYLTSHRILDLTSGFRAARREHWREFLHLLPNGFSTPTTTTLAFIKAGYSVRFEPVATLSRIGQSKIRVARDGATFFLILLRVVTIYSPLRIFVPVSLTAFLVGAAYAIWTLATQSHLTNSSVLLILTAIVIFLVGLVSDQVSALRFEGRR